MAVYTDADGERKYLPQYFKFMASNPLSVRTKVLHFSLYFAHPDVSCSSLWLFNASDRAFLLFLKEVVQPWSPFSFALYMHAYDIADS